VLYPHCNTARLTVIPGMLVTDVISTRFSHRCSRDVTMIHDVDLPSKLMTNLKLIGGLVG